MKSWFKHLGLSQPNFRKQYHSVDSSDYLSKPHIFVFISPPTPYILS